MLNFLRKRTKPIIWSVVIAFITWGGYAVGLQLKEGYRSPGRIFGKEVSFQDYLMAERAVLIFNPAPPGENPPTAEEIEARTWQFLVLNREAKRRKIDISDEAVRLEIVRSLGDKAATLLTGERYPQWIRTAFREEPREFEKQVRENLRIQKLLQEVKGPRFARPPARDDIPRAGTAPDTPGKPGASSAVKKDMGEKPGEKLSAWLQDLMRQAKIEVYKVER